MLAQLGQPLEFPLFSLHRSECHALVSSSEITFNPEFYGISPAMRQTLIQGWGNNVQTERTLSRLGTGEWEIQQAPIQTFGFGQMY